MNRKPQIQMKSPAQPPLQKQAVGFSVILSVLFHVAVIAALVVTPRVSGGHRLAPGPVSVRLVSLPGPSASGNPSPAPAVKPLPEPIKAKPKALEKMATVPLPEPEPTVKPVPIKKPAPVEVKESPKVVSLTPPAKPKTSLKKKTKDSSKIIKSAIDRIKKGANEPKRQPSSVNAALQRLKKQVADTEARRLEPYRPQTAAGTGSGAGGGGGGGGNRAITMEDIYRAEVAAQIEKNWAFPKELAGGGAGLEALLDFKVLPSGEITDIRFAAKSNNTYLDESAYKAIVKSNPVTPHPRGISKSFVAVGMRFKSEGNRE